MCANIDITDLSQNLGVEPGNAAAWQATNAGAARMSAKVSGSLGSYMADRRAGITGKTNFWDKVRRSSSA